MIEAPLLSIILPIYNVENYLRRCIDTLLSEEYKSYEIILVDDGSTDSCPEICDEYAAQYSFIKVIHKKNGGLSSARNAGLQIARGEYVFWLDSDDWICSGALSVISHELNNSSVDILKYNYYVQPSGQKVNSTLAPGEYSENEINSTVLPLALKNTGGFIFSAWSHVYRKKFLLENNLIFVSEREIGSEDYLFNLCAYIKANSVKAIDAHLYNYEVRMGSLSNCYRTNLSARYNKLYHLMKNALIESKCDDLLITMIEEFYVWHCYYIVMVNETRTAHKKKSDAGFKNVYELLHSEDLSKALTYVDWRRLTLSRKLAYWAMKTRSPKCMFTLMRIAKKK